MPSDGTSAFTAEARAALVQVLIDHWPTPTSGCTCGWGILGASFPEHVADVYEQMLEVG